jgi:hypothetical protein
VPRRIIRNPKREKDTSMTNLRQALLLTAVCGAFAMSAGVAHADPLGGKEPWTFQQQNRAGIAATMKAVEDGGNGSGGGSGGGGTTIVCGGTSGASGDGGTGSGASSTANSTCIIVNGSTGSVIDVDQDSEGSQSSTAQANSTTASSQSPGGSIDEVAAILGGSRQ